jgi:hypothetical protein
MTTITTAAQAHQLRVEAAIKHCTAEVTGFGLIRCSTCSTT